MKRKASVVVGLGYGDEGKGLVTDYLCLKATKPLVIRHNGGHQAGHTVVTKEGAQHIFASFGSGTLRGVPTYWSSYCTFSPAYFLEEYHTLTVKPRLFLDRLCPVTTHYDVLYNRAIETTRGAARNGSCGLGFGATVERQTVPSLRLHVEDIFNPNTLHRQLKAIRAYYKERIERETKYSFDQFDHDAEDLQLSSYILELERLLNEGVVEIVSESEIFSYDQEWETYIFEGAQGVLLDLNFGYAPHITKSNTTSRNALEILQRNFDKSDVDVEVFYVTRAYQTRAWSRPFLPVSSSIAVKEHRVRDKRV